MAIEGAPSYADLQREVAQLHGELAEARAELAEAREREAEGLAREAATGAILRVIAGAPSDLRAVLDGICESAARLCDATAAGIWRVSGDEMEHVAGRQLTGPSPTFLQEGFRRPIGRGFVAGRAVADRAVVHVPDLQNLSESGYGPPGPNPVFRRFGHRTALAAPLLHRGEPIGAILAIRTEVRPFTDKQIALLETYADQAVIAIENTRLFTELEERNRALAEALERQTATAEILRVIASSPTDLQAVLAAVAENAARLCDAEDANIYQVTGDALRKVAVHGSLPFVVKIGEEIPMASTLSGRAVLERRTIHLDDLRGGAGDAFGATRALEAGLDVRTVLAAPLLRDGMPIGTIAIRRTEVRPFTPEQIALLETFADQAVIAIENARLFRELKRRNAELSEALERQTATAEVLELIAGSPGDLQPTFDGIARRARELCDGLFGVLYGYEGGTVTVEADDHVTPENRRLLRSRFPMALDRREGANFRRVLVEHRVFHVEDAAADPYVRRLPFQQATGYRSFVIVPMLREGTAVGAIAVARGEVRPFTATEIELLQTFASQAVIAVENARLLQELRARVEELQALGEVGQAVVSSLELEQVLATIVAHAVQLSGTGSGAIYEYDETTRAFELRATHRLADEMLEALRAAPPRLGEGTVGRAAASRAPVQVADIAAAGAYTGRPRELLLRSGWRALLSVPLLRDAGILGGLTVFRRTPGAFPPQAIELLQTFASQSALAIQNARLYRELEDKGRELEAASRHKSEFLANMSHELRTPLNAINGFSEVLLERYFGELNDKQDEYLRDIASSGQHLLSLINDILDLSKVEAGRMELEVGAFSLREALQHGLTMLRERASRHGIDLSLEIADDLDLIEADERKVKQVVFNLLSNAVKFTPDGGRVDVSARRVGEAVEVAVSDTGVGIGPEDLDHIFEEFRQVGRGTARAEGTGLGLALAKRLVELHGGRIRVASAPGSGSTFTVALPQPVGLAQLREERAGVDVREGAADGS